MILNEKNLAVGMILQNETCYMRIGKIVQDTVYIEKLTKEDEKLIWTEMSKAQLLKSKPDIINRVPDKIEKIDKEIALYVTATRLQQLSDDEQKNAVNCLIFKDKEKLKNAVQLCTIKINSVKVFEYFWSSGIWIECSNIGRGEEYEIEETPTQKLNAIMVDTQKSFDESPISNNIISY